MKQRLSSVGAAVLTEDVFVAMNQMVRICTLSRYCSSENVCGRDLVQSGAT